MRAPRYSLEKMDNGAWKATVFLIELGADHDIAYLGYTSADAARTMLEDMPHWPEIHEIHVTASITVEKEPETCGTCGLREVIERKCRHCGART